METLEKNLTIEPAEWSPAVAMWLTLALQHASLADLRGQVDAGAALFAVREGARLVGAFVLRVDQTAQGSEGVIVAAGGNLPGFDFTVDLLPHVEALFSGVVAIRIHTARPGMARKLAAAGYMPREMVFAKVIE